MGIKETLFGLYSRAPSPISRWAYTMARTYVYVDRRDALFDQVFRRVAEAGLSGDYLEFGVYRGTSLINAYKLARKYGLAGMRFFAFDSFEGLPHSESAVMKKGAYASSRETFENAVAKAGVDLDKVLTVEGFYDRSLTEEVKKTHDLKRAAVVHVDCDLYSSATEVLGFVEDLMQPESVLVFDDWYSFRNDPGPIELMGERRAFREWRLRERFEELFDETNVSKSFVMK